MPVALRRFALLSVALAACSPANAPTPSPSPMPDARTTANPNSVPVPLVNTTWPVRSREHVDLWLHTYALLARDSMPVPYFDRGYRDRLLATRRERNTTSLVETNRDRLLQRIAVTPALATNGQFLPLYFESWDQMRQAIDLTIRANGNPNASNDPATRTYISIIASAFPSAPDREWLRTFTESADDESRRFHHAWWSAQATAHARVQQHVDSLWQRQWRPALQRYLNNTQQQNGELYLSFPLGGEGRTVHFGKQQNAVATPFPDALGESDEVLYVIAHEITGALASSAIEDNTTPAERREGVTSRYEQAAAVRAGALLLERTIPASVPGYMRYYLLQAGRTAPTDPRAAFLAAFTVPDAMRDAIARQMDVILGGI
jgi:hypothetical protein